MFTKAYVRTLSSRQTTPAHIITPCFYTKFVVVPVRFSEWKMF